MTSRTRELRNFIYNTNTYTKLSRKTYYLFICIFSLFYLTSKLNFDFCLFQRIMQFTLNIYGPGQSSLMSIHQTRISFPQFSLLHQQQENVSMYHVLLVHAYHAHD